MTIKQKLLDALGNTLDHISEERLIDILLDAFKAKQDEIEKLRSENSYERQRLRQERDTLENERLRMRLWR